jgi:hypothetical protein
MYIVCITALFVHRCSLLFVHQSRLKCINMHPTQFSVVIGYCEEEEKETTMTARVGSLVVNAGSMRTAYTMHQQGKARMGGSSLVCPSRKCTAMRGTPHARTTTSALTPPPGTAAGSHTQPYMRKGSAPLPVATARPFQLFSVRTYACARSCNGYLCMGSDAMPYRDA